jgi:glycerol-3-phosphate dehydrogenase
MWTKGWRDQVWSDLELPWDLIVIGGGITGAGILRESVRAGMKTLLLEACDFASGTSSRSSKLVHGGFRYLKNAQIKLTRESVHERERLIREGRGLITPLGFLMACYKQDPLPAWALGLGLTLYDLLAWKWGHRYYDPYDLRELCPSLSEEGLSGGYRYFDAETDDARLVLRVIQEAVLSGGVALNYAPVIRLLKTQSGQVCGAAVQDAAPETKGRTAEVQASAIINATGAWADNLRQAVGGRLRLRQLRGSHLIFPAGKLPLTRAVSLWHPRDGRPVMAFPWEGVTLVGTTDIDHTAPLQTDVTISAEEADYLMAAVQMAFPDLELSLEDVQGTFSGVRPVIGTGKADPSKESREHVLWFENGLLTVAGGKLTTFRLMALDALRAICKRLPGRRFRTRLGANLRMLDQPPEVILQEGLSRATRLRLLGRYGSRVPDLIAAAEPGELAPVETSPSLWAELRWAARAEGVVHLDDLLLRRVRLGLQLPNGGAPFLDRIRLIAQPELGWDDTRWEQEAEAYRKLWEKYYDLPGSARISQASLVSNPFLKS